MKQLLTTISLLVALFAGAQQRECIPVRNIPEERRAFDSGERVTYIINYTWGMVKTDVGEAKVSLNRKRDDTYGDHFHAVITGTTYKFYDVFFKVRDLFESKFSPENGRPYYFHRDISEGKYKIKNTFYFNPNYTINARVERKNSQIKDTLLKGRECTFDLVSLFYFARNIDFSNIPAGVEQPISFAVDDEIFEMYYRFIGKEVKRIQGLGQFNTLKFAARVVAGEVFSGKEELIIWVTDDRNKVPLMFETPIIVGKVTGRIISFENLKFPMSSKIR